MTKVSVNAMSLTSLPLRSAVEPDAANCSPAELLLLKEGIRLGDRSAT